jgi:de-etiolated-1
MSLFVVYTMTTTEVKSVYDNTSEELLDLFEKFCDFFRNTNIRNDGQGNQVGLRRSPAE